MRATILLLLLAAALARADEELRLRLRPTPEPITLEVQVEERALADDRELTSRRDTELFTVMLDAADAPDELLATITLTRAVGEMRFVGGDPRFYDSNDPDAGPIPTGAGRPGRPLVVRVSATGEPRGVVTYDGKPAEEARGGVPAELFERVKVEHVVRSLALGLQTPYPVGPCDDGWRSTWRWGMPGVSSLDVLLTNHLVETTAERVVIALDGRFQGETSARIPARAHATGRLVVSRLDGLLLEGAITTRCAVAGAGSVLVQEVERRVRRVRRPPEPAPQGRLQPAPDGY